MQVWDDGAWLVTVRENGHAPLAIAKGHIGRGPAEFDLAAGPHWIGEGQAQTARRNALGAAAVAMFVATYTTELPR